MSEMLAIINEQVDEDLLTDLEVKEGWEIKDDNQADWWIETNQEEISDLNRLEIQLKAKVDFYQQKLNNIQEKKEQLITFRDYKLIQYFNSIPDTKKKSTKTLTRYQLPSGTLQLKKTNPKYVKDEKKLLTYLESNHPEHVKTVKSAKWGDFKKQTKVINDQVVDSATGEVLPITLEEQSPVFEVKL